jgi:hypothetical protein
MLKTLKDLCPGKSPEEVLVEYAMGYFSSDWPPEVILAVLALKEPDRTYAVDDDDLLISCEDAVDVTEEVGVAEARKEVAALEKRLGELRRQLAGS